MPSDLNVVISICEEFTDVMLVDRKKNSIIVNVKKQWFKTLNDRLLSMRCVLVHKSTIDSCYTCTYTRKAGIV